MILKSDRLTHVHSDIRGPLYVEALRMQAAGTPVLKLNTGNPGNFGFRMPQSVRQALLEHVDEAVPYCDVRGMPAARKAILDYHLRRGLQGITMDDIFICNGVSEAVSMLMTALVGTDDEVLVPSPCYSLWSNNTYLGGGRPVYYRCDPKNDWNPDLEDMRSKITKHTKAVLVINPNNPTGALYPREVLQQIVDVARKHQLMILSDEIYDRLVMDDLEHVSIASLAPDLFCITFSGLSKSHMIAGYRIGWMVLSGEKYCAQDFILGLNMLSNMRLCSNVPAQSIVQTALWGHQSVRNYVVPGGRVCEQRDYVYKALNDIPGITAVKPRAAFYIFPKIDVKKFNITNDEQFALDLLHEKKILLVPGKGFNWGSPDHFRVVYLPRIEVLSEAMGQLGDFLSHYRQA